MCCNGAQIYRTELPEHLGTGFALKMTSDTFIYQGFGGLRSQSSVLKSPGEIQQELMTRVQFTSDLERNLSGLHQKLEILRNNLEQKQKSLLTKAIEIELKKNAIVSELERYETISLRAKQDSTSTLSGRVPEQELKPNSLPLLIGKPNGADSFDSDSYYGQGYDMLTQPNKYYAA